MSGIVLDASALLALILEEKGAELVALHINDAHLNTVNLSETLAKLVEYDFTPDEAASLVNRLQLNIHPFDEALAMEVAILRGQTKVKGLSLGDRACLAFARRLELPVLSSDQRWAGLDLDVDVRMIR